MADSPRQLCCPGQMLLRTLEISKIPPWDQKLRAFLTILYHQNLVRQQLTNLLQNWNGPNFWSRGGIFKKSSPIFLIWPGEYNILSQIAYFHLLNDVIGEKMKKWTFGPYFVPKIDQNGWLAQAVVFPWSNADQNTWDIKDPFTGSKVTGILYHSLPSKLGLPTTNKLVAKRKWP